MVIEKPSDILWNGELYEEDGTSYYRMIHCPNKSLKAYYYPDKGVLKMWIKKKELTTIPLSCPTREHAGYYIMGVYNVLNYIKQFIL